MKPHNLVTMSEDLIEEGQEWKCEDCGLIAPSMDELNLLDCTAAKPKDPHKSVTISEDHECKCAYCGLAAPSFEELNLLECKSGSANPYPNPHRRLSLVPDDLGWSSREWQCDYCGKVAPHPEELVGLPSLAVPMETDPELILCTYVYPPCKNCKHGPMCVQWCRLYEPSLPPGEWPAELVAMSHEDLIRKVVDLSNHLAEFVADEHTQKTAALAERLASLAAAAYDSIGKVGDEHFVKEWKRTAMEDFDIVAQKLNTDVIKNCPDPPEDWATLIDDGINGRISCEAIFRMGFQCWATQGTEDDDEEWLPEGGSLWLLPVNWYENLPEDLEFVSIYGVTSSRENGGALRQHRMGFLSYGIVHIENTAYHPRSALSVSPAEGFLGDEIISPVGSGWTNE